MKHLRLSAFAIAAVLLAGMTSCGGEAVKNNDSTSAENTPDISTELTDTTEDRKNIDDGLGNPNLDGYSFRIVADTSGAGNNYKYCDVEEADGDVMNDAVYKRNRGIEERFNCDISLVYKETASDTVNYIKNTVTAGENEFDLVNLHVVHAGNTALGGYFRNWYDIPKVDFSKPWWSKSTAEDLTYNGVCCLAVGDFALSALGQSWCTFYNKSLGADYGMGDYFDVVNSGKWTFDFIYDAAKDAYSDLNGNNEVDNEDQFGYLTQHHSAINAYLWSFDNPIIKNVDGELTVVYKTEKLSGIVEKIVNSFLHGDKGIRTDITYVSPINGSEHNYNVDMFSKSKCIFTGGVISQSLDYFRDMNDDYSILPYPKWDEEQEAYYTMSDGSHAIMAVPLTVPEDDIEKVGTIVEALCAESYKTVIPAYYDVALKVKGTRDDESVAMLDLIVESRIFDMGYVYDAWQGASFILEGMLAKDDTNIESYWASNSSAILAHYQDVISFFEDYGA